MKIKEFKKASLEWNNLVCPSRTIEEQEVIVESERQEFCEAVSKRDRTLECADYIWTLAYLEELHERDNNFLKASECRRVTMELLYYHDASAFVACRNSNYSKLMKSFEKAASEAEKLKSNPRYKAIRIQGKDSLFWLVGEDHKGDKVQYNKLLKPTSYLSKEELF